MMGNDRSAEAGALVAAIRAADAAHDLFTAGDTVLVAVSGGPDSVALLNALSEYGSNVGLNLHIAHLDHGLRHESVEDAAFVEGLAHEYGLPISLDARDVRSVAAGEGRGIEDASRVVRYSWLAAVAARIGASKVATGHHADDQAETVLMNLVRGAGLDGLAAMRARSPWPIEAGVVAAHEGTGFDGALQPQQTGQSGVAPSEANSALPLLIRPLLSVRRETILTHIESRGLAFREDSSNDDIALLRNRVRHEVLPALHEINPSLADALARGAASISDDVAALDAALDEAWPRLVTEHRLGERARIALSRTALKDLLPALQRRALRKAISLLHGDRRAAGWEHIESLRQDAVSDVTKPPSRDLPDGLRARFDEAVLDIGPSRPAIPPPRLTPTPVWLAMLGETALPGGWRVSVEVVGSAAARGGAGDPWTAHLDADDLSESLAARGRADGDRFQPSGMGGRSKSIQDFFVDLKVPAAERDGWPLIVSGDRIVWVPGHRVDERVTVGPETKKVIVIRVKAPRRLIG